MRSRRDFLRLAASAGALATVPGALGSRAPEPKRPAVPSSEDRPSWIAWAERLANPVLDALAQRRLKATMPVQAPHPRDRAQYTHLEAVGRLLAGLAPWLELGAAEGAAVAEAENRTLRKLAALAREGIDAITDPRSPDYCNFEEGGQPLVDAAFLAEAFVRAPRALWERLPAGVRTNVTAAMLKTRRVTPPETNWVLFASLVEVGLGRAGIAMNVARLLHGVRQHERWYLGDGMYGDGPEFHWDYYNAFVIQPMLLEVVEALEGTEHATPGLLPKIKARLTRYAEVQERLVAPDGTFPPLGRSLAYRCGAFQGLALAAWRHLLPDAVQPAQARAALSAVIHRTLAAPDTFDRAGWLRIGLAGDQPSLGEHYISTGSLYLCSVAFLPLGLPSTDAFWSEPAMPYTSQRIWDGENLPADRALKE